MKNIDIAEKVKGDIQIRIDKPIYNPLYQIFSAILPKRMGIGCSNIYFVSPLKTGNDSSKSQHENHMGLSSQGTSGLGGRSY